MKNVLMASSAIVGAAVLVASPAAAQELKISGFQQFFVSAGSADLDSGDRGFGFATNTEVHVNGSIMGDNGVTFGFHIEFEADAGSTNNVDENSITASGGFGKLEFGNNDGAEDTFMVNGSNSGVDYGGVGNPTSNFLTNAFGGAARTSVDFRGGIDTSDSTKITYTTPNFNGFQAGISYTPSTAHDGQGNAFDNVSGGVHDNVGLGLGYSGEFNGVGIDLGVVGAIGDADNAPQDTVYGIGGGLAISFSGFTIATGAIYDEANGSGDQSGWAWDAGIGYGMGPWSFSINGIYSEDGATNDSLLGGSANIDYNLAPGVTVFLTGYVGEEDINNASNNDIQAVTSGLKLSF